jgi:hypothetical protein
MSRSNLFVKNEGSFDNGEFQVEKPLDPAYSQDWEFSFGAEYSFSVEKLCEVVNYLISEGVLNTFNGKVEADRPFKGH